MQLWTQFHVNLKILQIAYKYVAIFQS